MVDRKLGRGLDFFLSGGRSAAGQGPVAPTGASRAPSPSETIMVDVAQLVPNPNQPRKAMGEAELVELADSIRISGLLQPILVRRAGTRLEIIAGERRWRAATKAGLKSVPVLVKEASDDESAIMALVENVQREDLNAMEKAHAFRDLLARFKASQDEVAKRVGLDRSTVANFVRLLDLTTEVQEFVSRGTLSMGHARCLLAITDKALQVKLADETVRQGLSVRALEALVREHTLGGGQPSQKGKAAVTGGGKKGSPAWLKEIEETLTETLGTPVSVRFGRKKSVIQIECAGRDEFERIYSRLKDS